MFTAGKSKEWKVDEQSLRPEEQEEAEMTAKGHKVCGGASVLHLPV